MVYGQPRVHPKEWDAQTPLGFWDTNRPFTFGQTTKPSNNQQEKENLQNCGLCCPDWPQNKIERKRKER